MKNLNMLGNDIPDTKHPIINPTSKGDPETLQMYHDAGFFRV